MVDLTARTPTPAELFADPPLVGRRAQLAQLEQLLDRAPAFAVVRGPRASGRRPLLATLGRAARASDWQVLQPAPLGPESDSRRLAHELTALAGPSGTTAEGQRLLGGADNPEDPHAGGSQLLAALTGRRSLLLFDGFGASEDVSAWILDALVAEPRRAGAAVVTVAAGPASALGGALSLADEVVDITAPTEEELREHFKALGVHLDPPAADEEVAKLAAGAAEEPMLVAPLLRALRGLRRP